MQIIIVLVLITFMTLFLNIERNFKLKGIKNNKAEISKSFGKKTENQSFERELIEVYWEVESAKLTENDRIDDITWYDLEMDPIYCMINNCKSFAGDNRRGYENIPK